jgi:hypothetical protein
LGALRFMAAIAAAIWFSALSSGAVHLSTGSIVPICSTVLLFRANDSR